MVEPSSRRKTLPSAVVGVAGLIFPLGSLVFFTSCRMDMPVEEMPQKPDMALPDAGPALPSGSPVIECGPLPAPPMGVRCTVRPSVTNRKQMFVRGTVLLSNKVLRGGEVAIDDQGRIACAGCDCGSQKPENADAIEVVCASGVLSPGLINTHDHITYTKAAPGTHPTNRYDHRHEWRLGVSGDPKRPRISVPGSNNQSAIQWGELRQVMAGTTSLVGSGQAPGVLRNLDTNSQEGLGQPPVEFDTFPLGDTDGERLSYGCAYPKIRDPGTLKSFDAYEPHISEGINAEAHNEFNCTNQSANFGQNLLLKKTALIHGIALTAADACLVAQRSASLIWSPRSNVALYGQTADAPMLDRAGVRIALGTDWTASGSMNLLRELKCAADLNARQYGGYFSAEALWRMTTINAAQVTSSSAFIGEIRDDRPGLFADLAIFQSAPGRLDHAAVLQAGVEDVLLVLRGGLPIYGDANVMEGLGAGAAQKCEPLDVCSVEKRLCAERETGKTLAALESAAGKPIYRLFSCGTPDGEPTCVPLRLGQYDGQSTPFDPDGDGLGGAEDNCPTVFNPIRPMDHGVQTDSDGDGLGDACDPCPLSRDNTSCLSGTLLDCDLDGIPDEKDNCLALHNPDQTDSDGDGQGDACDSCPFYGNPNAGPCLFTVKELRDPARGMRPVPGTRVKVDRLLILGLSNKTSFGFHARDLDAPQEYAGIQVFLGGTTPPKASDGTPLQVGQVVSVTGRFTVYGNQDEIDRTSSIVITGTEAVPPFDVEVRDLIGGNVGPAERLESLLVRVKGVTMRRLVSPTGDDDFFVTSDMSETCAAAQPPCARVGDFLLDGGKANGQPAFKADGNLSEVIGIVNGFANQYSIEIRESADIKP